MKIQGNEHGSRLHNDAAHLEHEGPVPECASSCFQNGQTFPVSHFCGTVSWRIEFQFFFFFWFLL